MNEIKPAGIVSKGKAAIIESKVYQGIRRKNRKEWVEFFKGNFTKFYNLITDDGEKALLVGIVGGILGILLFKEIFILAFLLLLAAGIVWMIADDAPAEVTTEENKKEEP